MKGHIQLEYVYSPTVTGQYPIVGLQFFFAVVNEPVNIRSGYYVIKM